MTMKEKQQRHSRQTRSVHIPNSWNTEVSTPWNLASLARNYPGIIVRQHHTDQKRIGLLKEQCGVKGGTSAVLLQSGLDEKWWADSMECYCYLRNIQDRLSGGKTPNERWFGVAFNGPVITLGAMVEYHPISAEDLSRLHQFGPKVLPGIFLGCALHAG